MLTILRHFCSIKLHVDVQFVCIGWSGTEVFLLRHTYRQTCKDLYIYTIIRHNDDVDDDSARQKALSSTFQPLRKILKSIYKEYIHVEQGINLQVLRFEMPLIMSFSRFFFSYRWKKAFFSYMHHARYTGVVQSWWIIFFFAIFTLTKSHNKHWHTSTLIWPGIQFCFFSIQFFFFFTFFTNREFFFALEWLKNGGWGIGNVKINLMAPYNKVCIKKSGGSRRQKKKKIREQKEKYYCDVRGFKKANIL